MTRDPAPVAKLHPVLENLFGEFNQRGLCWCLLRWPSGSEMHAGDVDLLMQEGDIPLARQMLRGLDFAQVPSVGNGLHFLTYHRPTNRWIWLHIVTELAYGPYGLLRAATASTCLTRRQPDGVSWTLAPDDAFWALLLHCLLDKPAIARHHRTRLQILAAAALTDGALGGVVTSVCPEAWDASRLAQCVADGHWNTLEQFGPRLLASWMQRRAVGAPQKLRSRAAWLMENLRNLPRRRGLSVALLGPDGAGKTTLVEGLQSTFIFPVRSVYMGLTGGHLPYVDRLQLPLLVVLGRLLIFWARYLRAQYHQARGRLVVFDRYVYDAEVPTPYQSNWLRRVYRWIDGHAIPGPDLVLVLNAPAELMYQRKGEYTPVMLEHWRQHFLALQGRIPDLEIVDSSCPAPVVCADVVNRIWKRYLARWRRVEHSRRQAR